MGVLDPNVTQLKGSTLEEQLTEADESIGDLTFSAAPGWVEIVNEDTENAGQFVVNGVTIRVPPDTVWGPARVAGTASATVTVSGSTDYIVSRYS